MNKSTEYFEAVKKLLDTLQHTQSDAVENAARLCADALLASGTLFTFGTGHSHLLAEEIFYRAGGLVRVYPIEDDALMLHTGASRSSKLERIAGLATVLLDATSAKAGDILFVFSNSGRNTMPVEIALRAQEKGMKVICITSLAHAATVSSRHPSGKLLHEVCDVVLDNCGNPGDAALSLGNTLMGATSTVAGACLLQAIVCRTAELITQSGAEPEIFASANVDGGDEKNAAYLEKYKPLIPIL